MAVVRELNGRVYGEDTDVALDKGAYTTVIGITNNLDVVDLSVRGEVIVEGTNQLSVVHCGGETSDENARLVREFLDVSVPGA